MLSSARGPIFTEWTLFVSFSQALGGPIAAPGGGGAQIPLSPHPGGHRLCLSWETGQAPAFSRLLLLPQFLLMLA